MNLLLIDRDASLGVRLREQVEAKGHRLDWLTDGRAGIDQARETSYDAIILDLTLSDMCGIDVCAQLREISWSLPILILSERNDVSDRLGSFAAGADDVMAKPFDFDELMARLKAIQRPKAPNVQPSDGDAGTALEAAATLLHGKKHRARRGEAKIGLGHPGRAFALAKRLIAMRDLDFVTP